MIHIDRKIKEVLIKDLIIVELNIVREVNIGQVLAIN
jgi:hypothetical protein